VARFSSSALKDPFGKEMLFSCSQSVILSLPCVGGSFFRMLWCGALPISVNGGCKFGSKCVST
jgi:hypothetical protein